MLQPFPYDQLWRSTSEKFIRDTDLRQDLVLMAFQQDKRFGERSDIGLLKHYMKLRAKEVHKRYSLGKQIGGKSKKDLWRMERLSIHKPLPEGSLFPIADMLPSAAFDPFGITVVNEFADALPQLEADVAEQMIAGYTRRESLEHLGISQKVYLQARNAVRERALEYLV